jgi:hypothetical protein
LILLSEKLKGASGLLSYLPETSANKLRKGKKSREAGGQKCREAADSISNQDGFTKDRQGPEV